jgi:hypothetical protein
MCSSSSSSVFFFLFFFFFFPSILWCCSLVFGQNLVIFEIWKWKIFSTLSYCRQLRGLFWTNCFFGGSKTREFVTEYSVFQDTLHKMAKIRHPKNHAACCCSSPFPYFDMLLVRGFRNLMFPLWLALLGDSFVFLDVGPSILFLVFPLLGVLWFIYDSQGFIVLTTNLHMEHTPIWSDYFAKPVIGFVWYSWWTLGGQFELPFS